MTKKQFFGDRGGSGAFLAIRFETFQTKAETARLSGLKRRWRDCSDQGGEGANKNQFFATVVEAVRLWRSDWIQREFTDQGGNGATFRTKAEMARLFRQWRIRRDQEPILRDRGGSSVTSAFRVETAQLSTSKWGRRDFLDRCGDGVTKKRFS